MTKQGEIMTPQEMRKAVKLLEKELHQGIITYNEFEAKIDEIMG